MPSQPQPPHDIMGLIVFTLPTYVWVVLGVLLAVALFFLVRKIRQILAQRTPKARQIIETLVVDPIQQLKNRLQTLDPSALRDQRTYEEFFFELSMITRQALEVKTGVAFTDMTYAELVQPLKKRSLLPVQETQNVLEFLKAADTIKFSREFTDQDNALKCKQDVGRWLEKLGPIVPVLLAAFLFGGKVHAEDTNDYKKEEKRYEAMVNKDPSNLEDVYNLGVAQYKQKKFEQAKQNFERSAAASDKEMKLRSLFNLGNTNVQLGDLQAAKQALQQALSYDLDNAAVRENLQWVEEQLKNKQDQQQNKDQQQSKDQQQDQQNQQNQQQDKQSQSQDQQQEDQQRQDQQQKDQQQGDKQGDSQNGSGAGDDEKKDKEQDKQQQSNEHSDDKQRDSASGGGDDEKQKQDQQQGQQQQGQQQQGQQQQGQQQQGQQSPGEGGASGAKDGGKPQQGNAQGKLSRSEVEKQDAERVVRSVEDDVSKSLYRPGDLEKNNEGGSDDIDW
ncbi:MAG: tol-pal system YbgF family protein [Oligoflexales bacterium]